MPRAESTEDHAVFGGFSASRVDLDVTERVRLTREDETTLAISRAECILDLHRDTPRDKLRSALTTHARTAVEWNIHTCILGGFEHGLTGRQFSRPA